MISLHTTNKQFHLNAFHCKNVIMKIHVDIEWFLYSMTQKYKRALIRAPTKRECRDTNNALMFFFIMQSYISREHPDPEMLTWWKLQFHFNVSTAAVLEKCCIESVSIAHLKLQIVFSYFLEVTFKMYDCRKQHLTNVRLTLYQVIIVSVFVHFTFQPDVMRKHKFYALRILINT